jgi:anti-sigma factor RsiW
VSTANRDEVACRELVELVTDYLEGTLPEEVRELFEAHLEECEGCRRYLEQMRLTIRLTSSLSEEPLASGTRTKLLQLFRDWNRA